MEKIELPSIAVIGTFDTKSDELQYLVEKIQAADGIPVTIDVSVLGDTIFDVNFSKYDVADLADFTIEKIANLGDENTAMQIMTKGAVRLIKKLYSHKLIDGFIALGCVIKGETPHFDFISQATTNAIMTLSIDYKKPVGNGIITCLNQDQAEARSKKGREAAEAVISILSK